MIGGNTKPIRRSRNFSQRRNTTCVSSTGWGVSTETQSGRSGHRLNVYRFPSRRKNLSLIAKAEINDRIFPTREDADAAALDAGFLDIYCRNSCSFVSNRSFRKHTGRLSHAPNYVYDNRRKDYGGCRLLWIDGRKMMFDHRRRWINTARTREEELQLVAAAGLVRVDSGRYFPEYTASPELFATMRPTRQPQ